MPHGLETCSLISSGSGFHVTSTLSPKDLIHSSTRPGSTLSALAGRPRSRMPKSKNAIFILILVLWLVTVSEVASFLAGKLLQRKWAMWRVPTAPVARKPISFQEYMERRDPVLGWPYPNQYGRTLDINGAQPNPYFPDGPRNGSCLSLYGDSFTEGGDTSSPRLNWGNVLSKHLDCYVANFGTGGYGTDQAYLRFLRNRDDPSPVVVFGLHPADALRNLTRIRDLENYEKWFALKPRFILGEDNKLELVPIPRLTEHEYLRAISETTDPLVLEHESLQPGGPAGVVKLEFPYTIAVARSLFRFYGFRSRLRRVPEWMQFLQEGHPLHGLEIMVAITREFVRVAQERQKVPLVVILPHPEDFRYRLRGGEWPYRHVTHEFAEQQLPFMDFGPFLLSIAGQSEGRLKEYFGPTGHFDDEGNALIARFVLEEMRQRGLIPLREHLGRPRVSRSLE